MNKKQETRNKKYSIFNNQNHKSFCNCILYLEIFFVIASYVLYLPLNFSFAAIQTGPTPTTFYNEVNPRILPACANGKSGFDGVVNCIVNIIKKLQPVAAILLVMVITISGGYLIFSPLNEKGIQSAKTALLYGVIGFVIVFGADLIRLLIREIAGQ